MQKSKLDQFFSIPAAAVLMAIVCNVLWGSAFPFIKLGYRLFAIDSADTASILCFAGVRFMIGAALVWLAGLALNHRPLPMPRGKTLASACGLGLWQTAAQYFFYYSAVALLTGAMGGILNSTQSFMGVILAHFLYGNKDRLTPRKALGCALGFGGVLVATLGNHGGGSVKGMVFMLIASVIFALAGPWNKAVTQYADSFSVSVLNLGVGGLALAVLGFAMGGSLHPQSAAGIPVLLILVIQGSIWINFSVPYLQHTPLYFLGYLIVNSIQMGANIDYAIVISSHYTDLKKVMRPREAIVAALNESFPTIFTSGSILASAGILISVLTTNPVIAAIGTCLGRGTIVSIMLVLFVLPQILILGDTIIERTSFEMKGVAGMAHTASGTMHVNGRVRGYINGVVDAEIKGVLHGQFSANIATGTEFTVDKPDMYLSEKNIHESEDGAPAPGTPDTPDTDTKGGDAE